MKRAFESERQRGPVDLTSTANEVQLKELEGAGRVFRSHK